MKVKVIKKSYLFGETIPAGEFYDFPEDKIPRKADGSLNFGSNIELIDAPAPQQAAQTAQQTGTQPGEGTDGKGNPGEGQGGTEGDKDPTREEIIKLAVDALDPNVDAHWVKKTGEPDLNAIKEIVGFKVSREDVETAAPGVKRPEVKK